MGDERDLDALRMQIQLLTAAVSRIAPSSPPASPPATRMHQLLERWRDAHRRLKSFACDYARAVRLFAFAPSEGPFAGIRIGDREAASLGPVDVDLWRAFRFGEITRLGRPPSPATINREVMMLMRILNFAVTRKTIVSNPLEGAEVFEEEDNAREVVIDEAGFAEIIEALDDNLIMRAFVTLAFDSGMRRTEVLLCRWSWLDRTRGYVTIPGSVAKNGQQRVADLTDRAIAAIDDLPRSLASDHVFTNRETGEIYDPRWLYALYRRAVESTSVRGPNGEIPVFHDTRRSWITLARRRGIPESEIMAKSGHQDHSVFRRYSIVGDEDLRRSRQRMEEGRAAELAALRSAERRGPTGRPRIDPVEKKTILG
ncbi:MAG TPA: tyrosine-type recombinase/integrase [Polyangia bacterium]|nr:tyrosine-type recombinase/integrase [Polyangia bacterium]